MKLLIVGGVAGGMAAATRARRLDEEAEIIVFERGPDVSFASCGLPYFIGRTIEERGELLVQTPQRLRRRFNLDVRVHNEVTSIDVRRKVIKARDLRQERTYSESYDSLLLATGAEPVRPPIPGIDDAAVYPLRNIADMDRIDAAAASAPEGQAVIIGGGFIGLEMAENLKVRGLSVAVAEMLPHVMPALDPEMAEPIHQHLRQQGVDLHLCNAAAAIEREGDGLTVRLKDGTPLRCDLVVLSVGVRPDTRLAREAGLQIGETGGIKVDDHMRTSDPDVYAVGDAVESIDCVTGRPTVLALAGPASRQGRIAADNICGRDSSFRGVQGTAIVKVFDLDVANTGASEKALRELGIPCEKLYVHPFAHADYYPGAERLTMKLLFAPEDGRILGAQIVGSEGVDKRIDVLSVAIQASMSVYDLEEAELAYAPPYGAAKDPVNMAGFAAANVLRGDVAIVQADEVPPEAVVIDVRTPPEYTRGHIPGSVNIPLGELRERLDELDPERPVAVSCSVGQRAYVACRLLTQKGFNAVNIAGGYRTYRHYFPPEDGEA
ncbi:MAG: FAD-dependent oxidoreductase [Planctomycetota bacterium]|jgi:NADPH-dependent 2,4-dienoyl-CoA reductase/sulfur reductase-like enzyme/rhodanese-related sulfurtransferase